MIIIHTAQLDGSLTLWGEDSNQSSQPNQLPDGRHRLAADAKCLAEAVGITPEDSADDEAGATVWLPSRGNNPIPSEALAGPAFRSRAKPRIKPWRVPILQL